MSEDLTKKLQSQDEKLTLVLSTVEAVALRVDNLAVHVDNFEQTVNARLYDSRPILQMMATDIAQLQRGQQRLEQSFLHLEQGFLHLGEGQRRVEEGFEGLRSEVRAFRKSVDYRFLTLSGSVLKRYNDLEH